MQSRRDFIGNLVKWAGAYAVSDLQTERAEKAADVLAEISQLDKHCMQNSLHAMDELIREMAGKGSVAEYRQMLKSIEKTLNNPHLTLAELKVIGTELNMAMPTLMARNPDILACYEQYTGGKGLKAIYADERMQAITNGYTEAKFKLFTDAEKIETAQQETLKVLTMDPAERGQYLDSKLGITQSKDKAQRLAEKLNEKKNQLEKTAAADEFKGKCTVWAKVQLKDYGYNINVHRKQVTKGSFVVDETYSQWEKRTEKFAQRLMQKFPDIDIKHERFQQGRIVALVTPNSDADIYLRDFHKEPERKILPKSNTPRLSFGLGGR